MMVNSDKRTVNKMVDKGGASLSYEILSVVIIWICVGCHWSLVVQIWSCGVLRWRREPVDMFSKNDIGCNALQSEHLYHLLRLSLCFLLCLNMPTYIDCCLRYLDLFSSFASKRCLLEQIREGLEFNRSESASTLNMFVGLTLSFDYLAKSRNQL